MSLLGIDVGTTGCKAAAFNAAGACLAHAYREYPMTAPRPGWAQLDSVLVWQRVREVIAEAARGCADDTVTALCVSSMGEAATPIGAEGRILGPCILGNDGRGAEYVQRLLSRLGAETLYRINPNIAAPCYTMPKLAWLRDHNREVFDAARVFLLWDGLVGHLLGCEPFVSYSAANRTLLFDIHACDWSQQLLDACDIPRDKLPRCLAAGTVAGTVSDSAARELGLARGAIVVAGGHDQCCSALGAGVADAGRAVDGIGTFECIAPVYRGLPDLRRMAAARLNVEHHVVEGLYTSFIYNQAGSLVRWFRDTFALTERAAPDIYERLGAEMPAEPTALTVLPYFEPSGAPEFSSAVYGVIAGLSTATTRGDILKAIMESATYYFATHVHTLATLGIDTSEFIATGGGATSDAWLQIKADIMGVPYVRLAFTDAGLAGTAILAGVAAGEFADVEEGISALVRRERVFEPHRQRHERYAENLERYRRLRACLRNV